MNFRENHLHEHELQLSDYNIKKYFDPNICISGIIYSFHFDLEKFISKNCKYIFFYQKFAHFGVNTSKFDSDTKIELA